jgi:F-type H+-transporting ATPase subunit epsilon
MLPESITLDVVTPDKRLCSLTVDEVVLPGSEGSLGVLPGHAPLLTALEVGPLMYRRGTEKAYMAVAEGFAEVLPDRVTVLAHVGERAEEIDAERAEKARERALTRLKTPDSETDFRRAQLALQKAVIRIQVAGLQRGGGA